MIDPEDPEKVVQLFEFAWGVYDTEDHCWVGNDDGPLLYDHLLARASATIVNERMKTHSRFRAKLFEGGPMHLRDEVEFKRGAEEAIQRIEGRVLPD